MQHKIQPQKVFRKSKWNRSETAPSLCASEVHVKITCFSISPPSNICIRTTPEAHQCRQKSPTSNNEECHNDGQTKSFREPRKQAWPNAKCAQDTANLKKSQESLRFKFVNILKHFWNIHCIQVFGHLNDVYIANQHISCRNHRINLLLMPLGASGKVEEKPIYIVPEFACCENLTSTGKHPHLNQWKPTRGFPKQIYRILS